MRRLLYVVTDDWYFVSHRLDLARAAIRAGYHVAVTTRVQKHGAAITQAGCELIPIEWLRRGTSVAQEIRTLTTLRRTYKAFKPDVIHHVAMRPVLYGSIAARSVPRAIVVNAIAGRGYAFTSSDFRARLIRPALRAAMFAALERPRTHVILQNPDDRVIIKGTWPDRHNAVTIIRGAGVDTAAFAETLFPAGEPVVMLAARMLRDKGVDDFVAAAGRLRGEFPRARFLLVGDSDPGNYSAIPEDELRAWHASGIIEWLGRRNDMAAVLGSSHIVCLPSTSGEGVPKVLIEAAAIGRPIVATDVPGCREIVRDGSNGSLVPPRNVDALAGAIRSLLVDAGLRQRMGHAGRELVLAEFALEQVVARTLPLYEEQGAV